MKPGAVHQGADTDVLRRALEHAMQLPRAWGNRWSSARLCQPTMRRTRPMSSGGRPPANRDSELKRRDVTGRSDPGWIPAIPSMSPYPMCGCSHVLA